MASIASLDANQEHLSIYVKNMAGDLLILHCSPEDSPSHIYSLVLEALEEPRPPLSALRLLQYDDEKEEFIPFDSLSDNLQLSLFINDDAIQVTFQHKGGASVGYPVPHYNIVFMEHETFELIEMKLDINDKHYISFTFAAHYVYSEEDGVGQLRYTDICYHTDDLYFQNMPFAKRIGGLEGTFIVISQDAVSGRTPADLLLFRFDQKDILAAAKRVESEWLHYIARRMGRSVEEGNDLIYPSTMLFQ